MKPKLYFAAFSFTLLLFCMAGFPKLMLAQNPASEETDSLKSRILGKFNNFKFGMYIDAYVNETLGNPEDTSNIVPFASNCPVQDQIRMNVAALEFYYNTDKIRGKLAIQYGDAPNLLAQPSAQFIKTLRQANFGFRVAPKLWLDFGYIFNPIGYESSWAVLNQISVVSVGGYFSPGSVLGAKLSWQINSKLDGGIMFGNFYSLAYAQNTNMYGIFFINYQPLPNLRFSYNNFMGDQALAREKTTKSILYNNIIATWKPLPLLELVGQFDFAYQTNSKIAPDTNKIAGMYSGFFQARVPFAEKFSVSARYEFLDDPNGFLTGINKFTNRGLRTGGLCASFEYKPIPIGYMRIAYRYLEGYPRSKIFYSNSSDVMRAVIFSTGIRF